MKIKTLETKLSRNGWTINGTSATRGIAVVEWHNQDGDAITLRVRRASDKDDILSDYCAGSWVKTYPELVRAYESYIKWEAQRLDLWCAQR